MSTYKYIRLTTDVTFEESPGKLIHFRSGSFGRLLYSEEIEEILKNQTKEIGTSILDEIDLSLLERECPAIIDGFFCMLRGTEFLEIGRISRAVSISENRT